MRKILLLIVALIVTANVIAQDTESDFQKVYCGAGGVELSAGKRNSTELSFFLVNGVQLTPKLFLGGGFAFPFAADTEKDESNEPSELNDCCYEDSFGGQLFVDLKYHLYDANFTPFIETTIGGGSKFSGEKFFNNTMAASIKFYPGNIALIYDFYRGNKINNFFGVRISAAWKKNMFARR